MLDEVLQYGGRGSTRLSVLTYRPTERPNEEKDTSIISASSSLSWHRPSAYLPASRQPVEHASLLSYSVCLVPRFEARFRTFASARGTIVLELLIFHRFVCSRFLPIPEVTVLRPVLSRSEVRELRNPGRGRCVRLELVPLSGSDHEDPVADARDVC